MDYFTDLLTMFLSRVRVRILAEVLRDLGMHQKHLHLCSEDERKSYGSATTQTAFSFWGGVTLYLIKYCFIVQHQTYLKC